MEKTTLKIPRPLYLKIKQVIQGSGFSSVNEFVVYVLRDLMSINREEQSELTKSEMDAIKKRLKNLGYF
jgi:Arc/MetJ-type ribon-helix-helix transcriptional regulator